LIRKVYNLCCSRLVGAVVVLVCAVLDSKSFDWDLRMTLQSVHSGPSLSMILSMQTISCCSRLVYMCCSRLVWGGFG